MFSLTEIVYANTKQHLSFVMYPIEKRYFIYKNNELGKFIKRIPLSD